MLQSGETNDESVSLGILSDLDRRAAASFALADAHLLARHLDPTD